MAEIILQNSKKKTGVPQLKKSSTRTDLTPMVDLGFLLITFFVFTATITQARVQQLNMPDTRPTKTPLEVTADKTLTLVLINQDSVCWYNGDDSTNIHFTNYGANGVRSVIQEKKNYVGKKYGKPDETFVIIKPTGSCNYGNVVNVLDEILITDIKSYMLLDADQ